MQYAWLVWSLLLIAIWIAVYFLLDSKAKKQEMFVVSLWTSLLGLTEPFFVPEYWSPPSLFNLAPRTGFDIESLIFSFGIGGLAVVLYERIFRTKHRAISSVEQHAPHHRYHLWTIISAPITFVLFGHWMEMRSRRGTSDALWALFDLVPLKAKVIRNGQAVEVSTSEIIKGDIKPGDKVPVDGEVVGGETSIDESLVTGESVPVSKKTGDRVIGGSINQTSEIKFKATNVGSETVLALSTMS